MKNIRKSIVAFTLVAALLVSACGLLDGGGDKDASEEIESVVSDFLDSVAKGDFADDDYKSSLISDKSFAKLKFEDDSAEDLMILAFEKIEYEIGKIKGDEDDEEGTCKVALTAVDLESILEDMDEGYEAEDLEDEISAKKAPTEEHDITFELKFDGDEWIISDLSELVDVVGKPFSELTFDVPEPTETKPTETEPKETTTEPTVPETTPEVTTVQTTAAQDYTADSVYNNISEMGWVDPTVANYVQGYTTSDSQITFYLGLYTPMPGLRLYFEFFNDNATTSIYADYFDFSEEDYCFYAYYFYDGALPADTYRYLVTMPDGTVLIDEYTTVS
ncbi:MAG: hypothetical protein JW817_02750 [Clostridiales bacterium]|nr:hypothetical protein [Clostridiales bacterium]